LFEDSGGQEQLVSWKSYSNHGDLFYLHVFEVWYTLLTSAFKSLLASITLDSDRGETIPALSEYSVVQTFKTRFAVVCYILSMTPRAHVYGV
jgi:hypothetical protein